MTRWTLEPPSHEAVRFITANARQRDVDEITAVCGGWHPEALADEIVSGWAERGAWGGVFVADEPVAVLTALRETPRSLQVGLIATDAFGSIAYGVTRYAVREIGPSLRAAGYLRMECRCWSEHREARRWLELCGARTEAVIKGYGAHGETFIQMAWS